MLAKLFRRKGDLTGFYANEKRLGKVEKAFYQISASKSASIRFIGWAQALEGKIAHKKLRNSSFSFRRLKSLQSLTKAFMFHVKEIKWILKRQQSRSWRVINERRMRCLPKGIAENSKIMTLYFCEVSRSFPISSWTWKVLKTRGKTNLFSSKMNFSTLLMRTWDSRGSDM